MGISSGGTPSGPSSAAFLTPKGFALRVLHNTVASGSATETFTLETFTPVEKLKPHVAESPYIMVTNGSGVVNFADESMSFSASLRQLSPHKFSLGRYSVVQIGSGSTEIGGVRYYKMPPPQRSERLTSLIVSWHSPALLRAITRPVTTGISMLNGTAVTVYQAHTTLAQLIAVTNSVFHVEGYLPAGSSAPSANKVLIPVRLWVDSAHRLVRMQATEPGFIAHYLDHNVEAGFQVDPTWSGSPLASLYKWGYEQVTIGFSQFGRPTHISAPVPIGTGG
jgi:hypothetical protein